MNGEFLSQADTGLQDGLFLDAITEDEGSNETPDWDEEDKDLWDEDDEDWDELVLQDLEEGEGKVFLAEAHEAIERLQQRTNKRGQAMKKPRRAESWQ
ncbi:MAG: hypothetical protein AB7P76_00285 [Candidatus Melainabacteria bacterium]